MPATVFDTNGVLTQVLTPGDVQTLLYRPIYIDAVNGIDTNNGNAAVNAVKTFARVAALASMSARIGIVSLSDVEVHDVHRFIVGGELQIVGRDYVNGSLIPLRRKLIFSGTAGNDPSSCARIDFGSNEQVGFESVECVIPVTTRANPYVLGYSSNASVLLQSCKITHPAGDAGTGCLFGQFQQAHQPGQPPGTPYNGGSVAKVASPIYTAGASGMAGRWFFGVGAGLNPQASNAWMTNVTQAMNS